MSKSIGMLEQVVHNWCSAQFISLHYLLGHVHILCSEISDSAGMFTHQFLLFKAFFIVMNVIGNVIAELDVSIMT